MLITELEALVAKRNAAAWREAPVTSDKIIRLVASVAAGHEPDGDTRHLNFAGDAGLLKLWGRYVDLTDAGAALVADAARLRAA